MYRRGTGLTFKKVEAWGDAGLIFGKHLFATERRFGEVPDEGRLQQNNPVVAVVPHEEDVKDAGGDEDEVVDHLHSIGKVDDVQISLRPPGPGEGILQPNAHFTPDEKKRLCRNLERRGIWAPQSLLFNYPCNSRLINNLKMLKSMGMTIPEQKRVVLESQLFVLCTKDEFGMNLDFLREEIGLDTDGVKSVLLKIPQLVEYRLDVTVKPFLEVLRSVGYESTYIALMFKKKPQLLKVTMQRLYRMLPEFTTMGFSQKEFFGIVLQNPLIFDMSMKRKIYPLFQKLQRMGLDQKEIVKVLTSAPKMLNMDWNTSIHPKLAWFEKELRLDKLQVVHGVFVNVPQVVVENSLTNFNKVVNILISKGLTNDEWRSILSNQPNVLGRAFGKKMSILHQRFDFLQDTLKKPVKDVVAFPAYLSQSFEKHILYRVALFDRHGVDYTLLPLITLFGKMNPAFPAGFEGGTNSKFRAWWDAIHRKEKLDAIKNGKYQV